MVGKTIFLYPGQGSQFPGMAQDLFDKYSVVKNLFVRASEACGKDMKALLFQGSAEDLKATENAQAAIVLASLAAREALMENGIESTGCAGHSLGEYTALADAGVLSAEDALRAVTARGQHMAAAAGKAISEKGEVGMAAVVGIGPYEVRKALEGVADVWSANENGPNQVVIAGTKAGMNGAEDKLKAAGARRIIPLPVSGPFHTPLMADAAGALEQTLNDMEFNGPTKLVWSNVNAAPVTSGEEARSLLVKQITGAVRWVDLTEAIAATKPDSIYEVGPGAVLSGLWKKSGLDGICETAGSAENLDSIQNN
jgi:[acyl-carrier-protein] S-malonyltransferase